MSSDCVWSSRITLQEGFAQGLICNECQNIPKKGYGRTCPNNHIYCKRCIDRLVKNKAYCTIKECKIQKIQFTESRMLPKVLERLIDDLQVKCPNYHLHCSWNGSFSSLSDHVRKCQYSHNDNSIKRRKDRLLSDNNIIYNEKKQIPTTKHKYGRIKTLSTHDKDDAFKSDHTIQKPPQKSKSISCPLKTLGCSHKMDATHADNMNDHFTEYQQKHLLYIINDYQQKFQSLENTVLFLQSQLKFVLNELDVSNQVIESQSQVIEQLNHKINVNIINKAEKPPKRQRHKQKYIHNLEVPTNGPTPPPLNQDIEPDNVNELCLSDNKRIAIAGTYGKRTLSSASLIDKLNKAPAPSVDDTEEHKHMNICNVVVIDNGSGIMKYGYNTDAVPYMFPTLIGDGCKLGYSHSIDSYQDSSCYVGYEAMKNEKFINIANNIIKNGMICDWNKMEKLWWYIFKDKLHIDPAMDCDLIVMNESLMNEPSNREKITQIMFEQFNVKSFYLCSDVVSSLHGAGKVNGTVIESGYDHTTISPIFEGVPFKSKSISTNTISGRMVNNWLHDNISTLPLNNLYNHKISKWKKAFVLNKLKDDLCFVNSNDNAMDCSKCYALPDGYDLFTDDEGSKISSIWINEERYQCTEECIMRTLPDLVQQCIVSCLNDVCSLLYGNICVSGGNTMFNGFGDRLKKDITHKCKGNYHVNIVSTKHQSYQCWKGGAIISSLDTIGDIVIHKSEYNEHGPSIIRRKCT
eukprot:249502_1